MIPMKTLPQLIQNRIRCGYNLKAIHKDLAVMTGKGWWWVINTKQMREVNSSSLSFVKAQFNEQPMTELDELRSVTLGEGMRTCLPVSEGKGFLHPEHPNELLMELTEKVYGMKWVLMDSVGECSLYSSCQEALAMLSSYDWNRNHVANHPKAKEPLWFSMDDALPKGMKRTEKD